MTLHAESVLGEKAELSTGGAVSGGKLLRIWWIIWEFRIGRDFTGFRPLVRPFVWEGERKNRTFGPIPAPRSGGGGGGSRDCNFYALDLNRGQQNNAANGQGGDNIEKRSHGFFPYSNASQTSLFLRNLQAADGRKRNGFQLKTEPFQLRVLQLKWLRFCSGNGVKKGPRFKKNRC